jgi:signal transduction histidine kinase
MIFNIPNYIFIPALLLLGALVILLVYNIILYLHNRESIILKYSFYLFAITLYIILDLYSKSSLATSDIFDTKLLAHAVNYIVIISYVIFLLEVAIVGKYKFKKLFFAWNFLLKITLVYIAFCVVSSFINVPQLGKLHYVLAQIFRILFLAQGVWAIILYLPLFKGTFANLIKWGGGIYLLFMIIVQLTVLFMPNKTFLGLYYMHWFYLGTFIEIIIFSFAVSYKIREALLKVIAVRAQMARDLHDDIGATLSSISIYGELAQQVWDTEPQKSKSMIDKMSTQSKGLMQRMNDIVWSLKTTDNNNEDFAKRILNYTQELLSVKDIYTTLQIDEQLEKQLLNPEILKNVLLISKEAINNIAKYSKATQVVISLKSDADMIHLSIKDNGVGFDMEGVKKGNGLMNMQKRADLLNAQFHINSPINGGVSITLKIPTVTIGY